jgi:3-methyl-2-oxobutanoate hydroxymethyltransferase
MNVAELQRMKRDGRKIAAVVVYDYQMAQIVDRAGVDLVSVGDSVGTTMWGQASEDVLTVEQMLLACTGVRRGVQQAVVSCDLPVGASEPVAAARRLMAEGGADLVKVDVAVIGVDAVRALASAGVSVWAQIGAGSVAAADTAKDDLVAQAQALEAAGAVMIDFRHSGPLAGAAVAQAVSIPVLGGLGGGPWLDGRVRAIGNAIGYLAHALDDDVPRYANVARTTLDAIAAYAEDVRAARQVRGERMRDTRR